MTDVVDDLKKMLPPKGTANGDINTVAMCVIENAINEIEHLRATVTILRRMAGPVSIERSSFHEIKREAKNGSQEPAPSQE